jgi:acyl carrier protein
VSKHQQDDIENWLSDLIGEILEIPPSKVDRTKRFDRYGLDSVAAVSVTAMLGKHLGRELDATAMYDYPTISTLSRHLAETAEAA